MLIFSSNFSISRRCGIMSILFHDSLHIFVYIYDFVTTFWHVYINHVVPLSGEYRQLLFDESIFGKELYVSRLTSAISYFLLLSSWISGLNLVLICELLSLNNMLNDTLGSVLRAIFSVFRTIFSSRPPIIIIRTDYFYPDIKNVSSPHLYLPLLVLLVKSITTNTCGRPHADLHSFVNSSFDISSAPT